MRPNHHLLLPRLTALAVCVLAAAPSWALYKVVGPDGRVTYTDRAPLPQQTDSGRVTPLRAGGGSASEGAALPLELRQAVQRYPVTLYTTVNCDPCESAKQMLRRRGVPYTERQVLTSADSEALSKLTGGREAPAASIGAQVMRGYSADLWNSYLDAANYPKESRLPKGYSWPAATPLTERREAPRAGAGAASGTDADVADTPLSPPAPTGAASGIRF